MKILLTLNKTYRGEIDGGYWNIYQPLQSLGHDVYLYDTVKSTEDFKKVVETFKPDLIYCCMTGNEVVAPREAAALRQIQAETLSGRIITYNAFLDDAWRFDSFSRKIVENFRVCSTTEVGYLEKYKESGYGNILLFGLHSNLELYPKISYKDKDIGLSFVGHITESRARFLEYLQTKDLAVVRAQGVTHKEMLEVYARSKIGINLSINDNHPLKRTQIKQRLFEIPAAGSLLITEYHQGIERYYEIDKEIVVFKTNNEFVEKVKALQSRPQLAERIAAKGHARFKAQHDSKIALKKQLEEIINVGK
jgi:spore maturation protein CgeB